MTNLTDITLAELRDGLKAKKFSATELADSCLAALDAAKTEDNFFVVPKVVE